MNYLELCQAVARESGTLTGSSSFTTVQDAQGRAAKIAGWVADAWVEIQNSRTDWLFRQAPFAKPLIVGLNTYTGASFDLAVSQWLPDTGQRQTMSLYDPAIGQADEGHIRQIGYDEWRDSYDFGAQTNGRPVVWAIGPDGALCIGPKPDKAYMLRGRYRRAAQRLTADTDIPIMPDDYHNAIVRQALFNMADGDDAAELLVSKANKYQVVTNALVIDQTPQVYHF